jgi:hypothetical protein
MKHVPLYVNCVSVICDLAPCILSYRFHKGKSSTLIVLLCKLHSVVILIYIQEVFSSKFGCNSPTILIEISCGTPQCLQANTVACFDLDTLILILGRPGQFWDKCNPLSSIQIIIRLILRWFIPLVYMTKRNLFTISASYLYKTICNL